MTIITIVLADLVPGEWKKDPKRSESSSTDNQGGEGAKREEAETSNDVKD